MWCPWKSLTWATLTYCLQISNWQSQTCRRHFGEDKAESRGENAPVLLNCGLFWGGQKRGWTIISQDERRGKTNAVLSGFTSIIHPLNEARTMRTKMACVKWSPWATWVKRLRLGRKKYAGHFRRRAPVRRTGSAITAAPSLPHLKNYNFIFLLGQNTKEHISFRCYFLNLGSETGNGF